MGHACFNSACFSSAELWKLSLDQECFILAYLSSAKHEDVSLHFVYFRMFHNHCVMLNNLFPIFLKQLIDISDIFLKFI